MTTTKSTGRGIATQSPDISETTRLALQALEAIHRAEYDYYRGQAWAVILIGPPLALAIPILIYLLMRY